jgi:hypothetical protein
VSGPKNVGNRHTGQCGLKTRLFGCDGLMIGRSLRKNVKEPINHIRSPNKLYAGHSVRSHIDILYRLHLKFDVGASIVMDAPCGRVSATTDYHPTRGNTGYWAIEGDPVNRLPLRWAALKL